MKSESGTPKKKPGRPAFEPTDQQRRQVKTMAGYGMIPDHIARVIGVSAPTLRRHFESELEDGLATAAVQMTQTLFKQATDPEKPNITAMIFWLKAKAGWRDRDAAVYVKKEDEKTEKAKEATESGFFAVGKPSLKAVK